MFEHGSETAAGSGHCDLDRAWRPCAQMVFMDTRIDPALIPEGWRELQPGRTETYKTAHFAEHLSCGLGVNAGQRVAWVVMLDELAAHRWRLAQVFPHRHWIAER